MCSCRYSRSGWVRAQRVLLRCLQPEQHTGGAALYDIDVYCLVLISTSFAGTLLKLFVNASPDYAGTTRRNFDWVTQKLPGSKQPIFIRNEDEIDNSSTNDRNDSKKQHTLTRHKRIKTEPTDIYALNVALSSSSWATLSPSVPQLKQPRSTPTHYSRPQAKAAPPLAGAQISSPTAA